MIWVRLLYKNMINEMDLCRYVAWRKPLQKCCSRKRHQTRFTLLSTAWLASCYCWSQLFPAA